MGSKINNYKKFTETYSEDVEKVTNDVANKYAVSKGSEMLNGFEDLESAFDFIADSLLKDGIITDAEKDDFNSYVSELIYQEDNDNGIVPQDELEQMLDEVLDKFDIIEPFKITNKLELEETPVDNSFDLDLDDYEDVLTSENADINEDDEIEDDEIEDDEKAEPADDDCFISSNGWIYNVSCGGEFLSEIDEMEDALKLVRTWQEEHKFYPNVWFISDHGNMSLIDLDGNILEGKCNIVGIKGEEEVILDTFETEDEANEFLPDYKKIYNTMDDMKIVHLKESMSENDIKVHLRHCNQGEYEGVCKYGDSNCPCLPNEEPMKAEEGNKNWKLKIAIDALERIASNHEETWSKDVALKALNKIK
jgi:hypothetical protein